MSQPSCATCILCLRDDYGYSNWTVDGTTLACLAGLNAALGGQEDPWNEEDTAALAPILDVALTCPRFRFGAPATLDVERENIPYQKTVTPEMVIAGGYTDDLEAANLLAAWLNRS